MLFKSKPVVSPAEQVLTVALQVTLTACVVHAYAFAASKGWQLASKKEEAKEVKVAKVD